MPLSANLFTCRVGASSNYRMCNSTCTSARRNFVLVLVRVALFDIKRRTSPRVAHGAVFKHPGSFRKRGSMLKQGFVGCTMDVLDPDIRANDRG